MRLLLVAALQGQFNRWSGQRVPQASNPTTHHHRFHQSL